MSQAVVDVRARRRDQTRAEIVEAAWQLAARDGIAGLSLRDLAAAVGMRAPSLYTYFDDKAAIYDAMFAEGYRQLDHHLGAVPDDGDALERLTAGIEAFLDFCLASPPRYQLLFTRAVPDWQPSDDAYAVSIASYERMVGHLEAAGVSGQDAIDLWTALTAGLASQQLANDPRGDRWARLARPAAAMFLAHVEGHR